MKKAIRKIKKIIRDAKKTPNWFSRQTGCDPAVIHRILREKVDTAGHDTMKKIYMATNGEVTPNDFYDFVEENKHTQT